MDGFALRAVDTFGASLTDPMSLRYGEQTTYVDTGDPLPEWANAVVPIELAEPLSAAGEPDPAVRSPFAIRIREALPPWKHVRAMGEDMVASELVLPAGQVIRPVDLGAAAGCGHSELIVARRPRVAIVPTGTELKAIGEPVGAGDIIEYNSVVLAGQVGSWGGDARQTPMVIDDFELISQHVLSAAADSDLVLMIAGSSAGSEDFSSQVVEHLGDLLVHGVAVRPGHPVILGMLNVDDPHDPPTSRAVPVVGVPGYPVSAALTGEIFVEPLLATWLGRAPIRLPVVKAELTRKIVSPAGDDDYVRMSVGKVGDRILAAPLTRGAGVISSLVRADGLSVFPAGSQGAPAGQQVDIHMYRDPGDIERTLFAIGSHDLTLDLLAQFLAARGRRLASTNAGSLGGLNALRRGEAHFAGAHLLDPDSGEYNVGYIERYLKDVPVILVGLVGREQGLMVAPGNPKRLRELADITRSELRYVNRQRGSGTRILLDYYLGQAGFSDDQVSGYREEEYSHLGVAAAVASGRADCGLGIPAAASALDLDFISLYQERYDLVIPKAHYNSDLLRPLLDLLQEAEFRAAVADLPGYDTAPMGVTIAEMNG
jgi:putative molybdopterin biosynthesis protein